MNLALFFLAAFVAVPNASANPTHCANVLDALKFAVANAPTNFAAINGGRENPKSWHFNLTPAAESFCPRKFILENEEASEERGERWFMKFDYSRKGTDDDVGLWIIKEFSAALKAYGYKEPPKLYSNDEYGVKFGWKGPSGSWVSVNLSANSDATKKTLYEVKVGHDVK